MRGFTGVKQVLFAALVLGAVQSCGGGTGNASTGSGLSGTWLGTGTRFGSDPSNVQIIVSGGGLAINAAGGSMHATRSGSALTISYYHGNWASPVSGVQSSAAALDLGAVSWSLGGHWTLSTVPADPAWGGDLDLASSTIAGQCRNASPPVWFPYLGNRQATCSKTAARTSLFGDLGGVWSCDAPSGAHCDFTFDGSSIASSCTDAARMAGTMKASFDGSTVSGSTSRGYEFAAHRVQ